MYKIIDKQFLNPTVCKMVISAPLMAKKAQPGQFVIVKIILSNTGKQLNT